MAGGLGVKMIVFILKMTGVMFIGIYNLKIRYLNAIIMLLFKYCSGRVKLAT